MARIDGIAKNYSFAECEASIYKKWQELAAFTPAVDSTREAFTIVMPPPNITGQLHIGHALDMSIQDTIIRQKRMLGYETLYLPGTDHASIATEAKILEAMRQEGLDKQTLGRQAFLERAWAWKVKYCAAIEAQIARMGISCDWSRLRFTMDEELSLAVRTIFVDLYNTGYIYRGERMVNWCPNCQTTISDAEVEHSEREDKLWTIAYSLADGTAFLEVATTRPETMLGDTALAVNPEDERYKSYIGQTVVIPLVGRLIPIIADTYVEQKFGTGVVKITPAHDPNDFEVGQRHNLPLLNIMNGDGTINEAGGKYAGLAREKARSQILQDLEEQGLLRRTESLKHSVGCCQRCSTIIEPLVSLQWFVAMQELAQPAIAAVRSGEISFVPERFEKNFFNWMENTRDWCISRQLWWGHRIPAWYCAACGEITVALSDPTECAHCHSSELTQDEDSLDTWFSSAFWPFTTLGWPQTSKDMAKFYPTNCLVTGYDIITFWVSRMIFSALHYTKTAPFKDVVVHGLVRDEQGRKMSKSLGNGIDPLDKIACIGVDALRFALMIGTSPGSDLRYSEQKEEAARNFTNKIWNAFRFVILNSEDIPASSELDLADLSYEDAWILDSLQHLITDVSKHFQQYDLGLALDKVYTFLWDEFCDWYIEMVKPRLRQEGKSRRQAQLVLNHVLCQSMKMLHPFLPFLTEEIFAHLQHEEGLIATSTWPVPVDSLFAPQRADLLRQLMDIIKAVRNIRSEWNLNNKTSLKLLLQSQDAELIQLLTASAALLRQLANIASVEVIAPAANIPVGALAIPLRGGTLFLPLGELIDVTEESTRLRGEARRLESEIARAEGMLANESFVARAPVAVVQKEREKIAQFQEMLVNTTKRIESLACLLN